MSLTLQEARTRGASLSDVSYAVTLDLTGPGTGWFGCRTSVRFRSTAERTFLELTDAAELRVTVNGAPVDPAYQGTRIPLTGLLTDVPNEVVVEARLPFVTDGAGMHTMTDPADGETYVSAYVGMDLAQKVFPCFDQNDLKAPIALTVHADPAWSVLANGRTLASDGGQWRFATTPPIPVALFVVAAGPWASQRWEHAGLAFGWHARASLADELARDVGELRAITEGCFDHFAELFEEPYPFDSFDQVFVPGLNWGAQEMPGCVTYRDELLPRGAVPEHLRLFRAAVIAHEMSHMWFGDLVTMTWWEDTWLQESFADYMGYRVAADGAGFAGALLGHEAGRKPGAYDADERRSTHPVAPDPEDVPDVDSAAGDLRRDLLRQGQLGAPPAGDVARRRDLPPRREHLPDAAPLRERHPRRLRRRARRGLRPRRARVGRGVAPAHRLRHAPGRAGRRGPGPAPRRRAAAPGPGHGVRRGLARGGQRAGRRGRRAGAAAGLRRPRRGAQRPGRDLRPDRPRRALVGGAWRPGCRGSRTTSRAPSSGRCSSTGCRPATSTPPATSTSSSGTCRPSAAPPS